MKIDSITKSDRATDIRYKHSSIENTTPKQYEIRIVLISERLPLHYLTMFSRAKGGNYNTSTQMFHKPYKAFFLVN